MQVGKQTTSIDEMLKTLVCGKTKVPHMNKTVYNPSCLRYCSELCGVRCKNLCNQNHTNCKRGKLPENFLFCPSASTVMKNKEFGFITYESLEVDTYGKGKPYKRTEKVVTDYPFEKFEELLKEEFNRFGEHTLSYWFLRSTKIEAFAPSEARSTTATITADFGEAIQIVGKHETSDQFYHRPEVQRKLFNT